MKLAMSILVRDEVDIIGENIEFHAAHGVDAFVVTDNGSIDGTRDLLSDLSRTHPVTVIDEPNQNIDQDIWVSEMARYLREKLSCDWVINNDSDEFWVPAEGDSLPATIQSEISAYPTSPGVLSCARYNLMPDKKCLADPDYRFFKNLWKVVGIADPENVDRYNNILLKPQREKVITKLDGLISVGMGNHDAEHNSRQVECNSVSIFHYPLRTYKQFLSKVTNHGSSIKRNTRFGENVNWHLRYWYQLLSEDKLKEEYYRYVLEDRRVSELLADEVIVNCNQLEQYFTQFQNPLQQTA